MATSRALVLSSNLPTNLRASICLYTCVLLLRHTAASRLNLRFTRRDVSDVSVVDFLIPTSRAGNLITTSRGAVRDGSSCKISRSSFFFLFYPSSWKKRRRSRSRRQKIRYTWNAPYCLDIATLRDLLFFSKLYTAKEPSWFSVTLNVFWQSVCV